MRLFAQLSWYFRREWRRYLGSGPAYAYCDATANPAKWWDCRGWRNRTAVYSGRIAMWIGTIALIAVVVYLLLCLVTLLAPLIN